MFFFKPKKNLRIGSRGPGGGGPNFIFLPEFLFILVRSPCKHLKSYNNPSWDFNNGGKKKKKKGRKIPKIVVTYFYASSQGQNLIFVPRTI
jgi:hypothetical protein